MAKKYESDNYTVNTLINGNGRIEIVGDIKTTPNGIILYDHRTMYTMLTSQIIQNTINETTHFNDTNALGTRIFPANFLKVGHVIRLNIRSDFSCSGNPTNTLRIKFGGNTIVENVGQLGSNHNNSYAELQMEFVVRSVGVNGSMVGQGRTMLSGNSDISRRLMITTPVTINTTISNLLDVTYQWGQANVGDILIATNGTIQILN